MIRLSNVAACILATCAICRAQTNSGTLGGVIRIGNTAGKIPTELSVVGESNYTSFQVPALPRLGVPQSGYEFRQTGLIFGTWYIAVEGGGFCSKPVPITNVLAANMNSNFVNIVVNRCAQPPVIKLERQSRAPGQFRLQRVSFITAEPAQNRISGTVRLANGRVAKRARVQLRGVQNSDGATVDLNETYTDDRGLFSIEFIHKPELSQYLISMRMPGYQNGLFTLPDAANIILAPIELKPFESYASPQIRMEPMLRHIFTPDLLTSIPLSGFRGFDDFALLLPGVFPAAQTWMATGPSLSPQVGTAGQFAVNGLRSRENNFVIDGSDTNDEQFGVRRQGFVSPTLQTPDTLGELQVVTAIGDTRYGRNIGGQVDALSTSASQFFHWETYGFASNSRFNARDYFDAKQAATLPVNVSVDGQNISSFTPSHQKEPSTATIAGGTAGGSVRIWKRPSFLFGSFEHQNLEATRQFQFATPSAAERQIDPSQRFELTGLPSDTNIPLAGEGVFSLFPFPNNAGGPYGANTYTAELPQQGSSNLYSFKFDQPLTDALSKNAHSLNIRYRRTGEISVLPVTGGALDSGIRPDLWNQNVALFLNSSFAGRMANNLRASYGTTHTFIGSVPQQGMLPSNLVPGATFLLNAPLLLDKSVPGAYRYQTGGDSESITGTAGEVSISGFSSAGVDVFRFPQTRGNSTWQLADTLTATHGSHIFSAGFDLRLVQLSNTAQRNARPSIVFGGLVTPDFVRSTSIPQQIFTPTSLAAAGLPSGIFQTLAYGYDQMNPPQLAALGVNPSFPLRLRNSEMDVFAQDEWRPKPWLAITAGLRLAFAQLPSDVDDRILHSFDRPALLQLAAATAATPDCAYLNCGNLQSIFANEFPPDLQTVFGANSFRVDPRVGIAVALSKKTVLRGGWGRYSGQFPAVIITESQSSFPDFLPVNIAGYSPSFLTNLGNSTYNQSLQQQPPVTSFGVLAPATLNLVNRYVNGLDSGLNPVNLLVLKLQQAGLDLVQPGGAIKAPYSLQQALLLEREFGEGLTISAGYVGTMGRQLLRVTTPDLGFLRGALLPAGAPDPLSPRPLDTPIQVPAQTEPDGLFSLSRELYEDTANSSYHSLQIEARKQRANGMAFGASFTWAHAVDDASDFFDSAGTFALPQDSLRGSERSSSSFDSRIRGAGYFLWSRDSHGKFFAGWDLSGVFTAQRGQPFTVNTDIDVNRDGNLTDRPNTTAGLLGSGQDRRTVFTLTANPATLLASRGIDGAVGRNAFQAPAWFDVDLAATARFHLGESHILLLRAEAFNALNRANFGIPVRILEAPEFGSAVNTITPPRSLRVVMRIRF